MSATKAWAETWALLRSLSAATCPVGTTPIPIESVTVLADGSIASSVNALNDGEAYFLEVSGTAFAGDYFVAIAAENQYGEGPVTALSASVVAIAATESIDMKWAITDNAYPATGYVVYRSEKDPTTALADTPLYPVFRISVAELATGYDGAAAGLARDRNFDIPNTEQAFMYQTMNADIMAIKELGKMKKLDLAITSPTYRFAILYYLTMILYQPQKLGVIKNIGKITA